MQPLQSEDILDAVQETVRSPTRSHGFDIVFSILMVGVLVALVGTWLLGAGPLKQSAVQYLGSLLLLALSMAILAIFERRFPAGPNKPIVNWGLNLKLAVIFYFALTVGRTVGTEIASVLRRHFDIGWIDLRFADGRGVWGWIGAFFLFVLIIDFFYYWNHRLQHTLPFLWQQHKVHHMDENMNVSTKARTDWGETFLTFTSAVPIAIIFKLDTPEAGLFALALAFTNELWLVFAHSNIKLHMGMVSLLLVGPQEHRIHHSRLLKHRHKNFAAYFPIWDIIFGTYYHPHRDDFPPTGVDEDPDVKSVGEAMAIPFKGWMKMFRDGRLRAAGQ